MDVFDQEDTCDIHSSANTQEIKNGDSVRIENQRRKWTASKD